MVERGGALTRHPERLGNRDGLPHSRGEAESVDQFHHQIGLTIVLVKS